VAPVQQDTSGQSLPPGGKVAARAPASSAQNTRDGAAIAASSGNVAQSASISASARVPASANDDIPAAAQARATPVQSLVTQLNKTLNDSGRPDQYRVDPQSANMIQEVNPANGAVIGQFSADEFPALARSVGATGLLIDSLA
jgi:hypothetical protein